MDSLTFDLIAYGLLAALALLAVLFLVNVLVDNIKRRKLKRESFAISARASAQEQPCPAPPAQGRAALPERADDPPPRPPDSPPDDLPAASPPSRRRGRLQELLDRGVALEENARSPLGALSAVVNPPTTQADVTAWEAAVEAELMNDPKELALFRYERPRSPLVSLTAGAFDNLLRRRLEQRNEQLGVIIKRLR